ncbi:MAG: hypothetical protein NZ700_13080 [Gemmataceae bacterium]|nr:hypothetical protein [Gemmataceae bacterium]MDW8264363.1 hypothetical protein [Gemmataceae bacterium]
MRRSSVIMLLLAVLASMGASYRTPNFLVEAATPQIAQQIGQAAEHYRRDKALEWLGREMPPWPQPCPIRVTVTWSGAGGATSFAFDHGQVLSQHMHIEGSLDRLLNSVLPHEVTHTVFAHHFRRPVPRWADEGGSVLSEDEPERQRHEQLVRQIIHTGRAMPLRRLFALKEYPPDVMVLYAQGYSVVSFLVSQSNRQTFLNFVAHGMTYGWDQAAMSFYRYRNVEELEKAWLEHLRQGRRPPTLLAQNTKAGEASSPGRVVVRQTVPPAQPFLPPVVRGQSPEGEPSGAGWGYLPASNPPPAASGLPAAGSGWQPVLAPPPPVEPPPLVRLGLPQPLPAPVPVP